MIDYYFLRRQRVDVEDLFREQGPYSYRGGWNPLAVTAFILGSVPAAVVALTPGLAMWAPFSWFIGAAISAVAYAVLARGRLQIGGVLPDGDRERGSGQYDTHRDD
jgi:NCS1 family nucleobase:cation symporter-1